MSLNKILHDEQIALMRHASATSLSELARQRGEIDRISAMLARFTYPHRPYVSGRPSRSIIGLAVPGPAVRACLDSVGS